MFALEHGLTPPQRSELQQAVEANLRYGRPERKHWLVWVVHATEIGYDYTGQEYWQSFAARSPGWVDDNRNKVWFRGQFRRFADEFCGVTPKGRWADHFTIICWPIFNAVLPQDLQRQFVRYLDMLGATYTDEMLRDPELLGAEIQIAAGDATSRFRQFATNTELVGLIASALLLQGFSPEHEVIEHNTMDRILDDLERRRQAKELLERARQHARSSVNIYGAGESRGSPSIERERDGTRLLARLGVEPSVTLRPDNDGRWSAHLRMPDLASVAPLLSLDIRNALQESPRFRIAGDRRARPRAGGALMYALPDVELARWPAPSEPLVKFESPNPLAEQLLDTRLRIGGGPVWLFRIQDSGEAKQVRGKTLRGDGKYLVVSNENELSRAKLESVPVDFEDAFAAVLEPSALSPQRLEEVASVLNLSLASTFRVRPAGLVPLSWDGEGEIEWLLMQPKIVAIEADCPEGRLALRESGRVGDALEVPISSDATVFVELDPLEIGEHVFELEASTAGSTAVGRLRVLVRRPSLLDERALPMVVSSSPRAPSLEDVWGGRFQLDIDGPVGHRVKLWVAMCSDASDQPLIRLQLPSMTIPVDADEWQEHLARHFRRQEGVQECYDASDSCELVVDGLELGSRTFHAEREPTPIRWIVRRHDGTYHLELRDDRGVLESPELRLFQFSRPDEAESPDGQSFLDGPCASPDGGLYIATADGVSKSVIVGRACHDLGDLQCSPALKHYPRSASGMHTLLLGLRRWTGAPLPGHLDALVPLQTVVGEFEHKLVEVVCGPNWSRAERAFAEHQDSASSDALADTVANSPACRPLSEHLKSEGAKLVSGSVGDRSGLFATVVRMSLGLGATSISGSSALDGRDLPEFALRLASAPEDVLGWAGDAIEPLLAAVLESPVYLRAARWVVLNCDQAVGPPDYGHTHKAWEW